MIALVLVALPVPLASLVLPLGVFVLLPDFVFLIFLFYLFFLLRFFLLWVGILL